MNCEELTASSQSTHAGEIFFKNYERKNLLVISLLAVHAAGNILVNKYFGLVV